MNKSTKTTLAVCFALAASGAYAATLAAPRTETIRTDVEISDPMPGQFNVKDLVVMQEQQGTTQQNGGQHWLNSGNGDQSG